MPNPDKPSAPGRVFVEPVRKAGRQKHSGTITWLSGHMVICIGYTPDGHQAVYMTPEQLDSVRRHVARKKRKITHRLLRRLIMHYEGRLA